MRLAIMVAIGLLAGEAALADPVTGKTAQGQLFDPAKPEVVMAPANVLSAKDQKLLQSVLVGQPYFGAIAVSPDEGLASEATVAAANHHTAEAATRAALDACESKRKGKRPCAIVGTIRPEGWKPQALSLSSDATKGFRETYGSRGPRALAISPSTGRWGLGKGEGAGKSALAECAKSGAADCILAVAD